MNLSFTVANYWSRPVDEIMRALDSGPQGLDTLTAAKRLKQCGQNRLAAVHSLAKAFRRFLERFRDPLVLILIFAAVIAFIVHDWLDALIVLGILFISVVLSFIQEYRATQAVEKLRQRVAIKTVDTAGYFT